MRASWVAWAIATSRLKNKIRIDVARIPIAADQKMTDLRYRADATRATLCCHAPMHNNIPAASGFDPIFRVNMPSDKRCRSKEAAASLALCHDGRRGSFPLPLPIGALPLPQSETVRPIGAFPCPALTTVKAKSVEKAMARNLFIASNPILAKCPMSTC